MVGARLAESSLWKPKLSSSPLGYLLGFAAQNLHPKSNMLMPANWVYPQILGEDRGVQEIHHGADVILVSLENLKRRKNSYNCMHIQASIPAKKRLECSTYFYDKRIVLRVINYSIVLTPKQGVSYITSLRMLQTSNLSNENTCMGKVTFWSARTPQILQPDGRWTCWLGREVCLGFVVQ